MTYIPPGSYTAANGTWGGSTTASGGTILGSEVALFPGLWAALGSGSYFASYAAPNGYLFVLPFTPSGSGHIDQMAVNVITAGTAGAIVRFGLFQGSNPAAQGLTLLQDYGTSITTGTGIVQSPVSPSPSPVIAGQSYWAGIVPQGSPATPAALIAVQGWNQNIAVATSPIVAQGVCTLFTSSGIPAGLPFNTPALGPNNTGPVIQVHMVV